VVKVIRNGNFLAVAAQKEFQAIKAMRALAATAQWVETAKLPDQTKLHEMVLAAKSVDYLDLDKTSGPIAADATTHEAAYFKPYQSHGSVGPSCAVAHMKDGQLTVWTHTQGVYPDRAAIAQMLKMKPEQVRCVQTQGSGCYGHNGADDAAGDAAMIATALPGTPVRVQWMREQELAWEPFGPTMATKARAQLANGKIVDWHYEVWSQTHNMRPGGGGALLAAQHMENPLTPPKAAPLALPEGGGDRNALPLYSFPNQRIIHHFQPDMPIRVSALRSLGAYMNVFSLESFMDELALAAKADPVAFRLAHMQDKRAQDVIKLASQKFGWDQREKSGDGRGYGFAFGRYKNLAAYCALAMEVEVTHETGRVRLKRITAAVDAGQIINPDGIRNQIEGAIIQSASWTLYEGVSFDNTRITSVDWATYPILRFSTVPDTLDVHLIDRPGLPFLGAGEAGQGPAGAAVANAIADATGKRLRNLPLSPDRVKESVGV
ncbi:MAG TPA: molybdopterin cofactor-binding domain-containing protein, partial [Stellaceae bacterium]|nr:molybdopterin cofactor-binding domain-containing protein [Stellaceae bacterium]